MRKNLTKQVIYLAIVAFVMPSCKKAMETVTDKVTTPTTSNELRLKTDATNFSDTDFKGVCWEPFNSSWTNSGTATDGTDLVTGGAKWVRVWFAAAYTTTEMDAMVNLCNTKGLKIIACYNKKTKYLGQAAEQTADVNTLTTWVNRYKTSIHYWEVQNEPNLDTYWKDAVSDTSVTNFVTWLHHAHDAIKGADPSATVVLAGISSWSTTMLPWMDKFTANGGYNYIDEVAYHPYDSTPDYVIATLNSFRSKMAAWPSPKQDLPIWITEVGFHTGSLPSAPSAVPSEAIKAQYLTQTYKKITQNLTWKRPICWYILHEKNPGTNYFNLLNRYTADPTTTYPLDAYTNFKNLSSSWNTNQTGDGVPIQHEAESEVVSASSGGTVRDYYESGATNGGATIIDAAASSGYMTFKIPNVQAGSYTVVIGVKKGTARGIFHLYATPFGSGTGNYIGSTQDMYSASVGYTTVNLGTWTVSTYGDKAFKFEITGKNASSSGTYPYAIAVDYIQLTKQP